MPRACRCCTPRKSRTPAGSWGHNSVVTIAESSAPATLLLSCSKWSTRIFDGFWHPIHRWANPKGKAGSATASRAVDGKKTVEGTYAPPPRLLAITTCEPTGVLTTPTAHAIGAGQSSHPRTSPPNTRCANSMSGFTSVVIAATPGADTVDPAPPATTGPGADAPDPALADCPDVVAGAVAAPPPAGVPLAPAPGALYGANGAAPPIAAGGINGVPPPAGAAPPPLVVPPDTPPTPASPPGPLFVRLW